MPEACVMIDRNELGPANRIIATFDHWSAEHRFPRVDIVFLNFKVEDFGIYRSYIPDRSGFHFVIPVCLLGCLNEYELGFMFEWTCRFALELRAGRSETAAELATFRKMNERHAKEEILAIHLKCQAVRFLWSTFHSSPRFIEALEKNPSKVIKVLKCEPWKTKLKLAIRAIRMEHPFIRRIATSLSPDQLQLADMKAVSINRNGLFPLTNPEVTRLILEALETERKILKKAA